MDQPVEITFKPVSHLTADAIGPPGQRVFYLQGWKGDRSATVIIEKFQLQQLAIGVEQFLAELSQRLPLLAAASNDYEEERMRIHPPVEPLFRVAEFGLAYDPEEDLMGLIARETPSASPVEPPSASEAAEAPGGIVRFWATRHQMRALVHWGIEVSQRGRPLCEQCGQPMDPEGHFCARKNGHRR
jgi:uncharacterized repeat protein (TIGR03847 family)